MKKYLPLSSASDATGGGLSINIADSSGFTPLHIAVRLGHEEIVTYLLKHTNIDVNARTINGNTPFLYACAKPSLTIVRSLLEAGSNFFIQNKNGDTCILCASLGGNDDVFEFVVNAFHDIRTSRLPESQHRPWEYGRGTMQAPRRFFLHKNEEGLTTLMCAVMGGSKKIVKRILLESRHELGINIPEPAPSATTTFFPSILGWGLEPLKWKLTNTSKLFDPAPPTFMNFVDAQNLMGDTALHIAAQNQSLELFTLLLEEAGADPMKINRRTKRSFELFEDNTKTSSGATVEDVTDESASTKTDSTSNKSFADRAHEVFEIILKFQQTCRTAYIEHEARESEKLFSELMGEEGSSSSGGGGKKKKSNQQKEKGKKKKSTNKVESSKSAATIVVLEDDATNVPSSDDDSIASDSDDLSPSRTSSSSHPNTSSSTNTAAASSTTVTEPPTTTPSPPAPLSSSAQPFVPMAELAAIDAASGWSTVTNSKGTKKNLPQQQSTTPSATSQTSTNTTTNGEKSKTKKKSQQQQQVTIVDGSVDPKVSTGRKSKSKSTKSKASSIVADKKDSNTNVPSSTESIAVAPAAAVAATAAAVDSTLPRSKAAAWHPAPTTTNRSTPATRTTATNEATPVNDDASSSSVTIGISPSSPSSSSFSPSSSSTPDLDTLFASLHPRIDSTDLQLRHFLGEFGGLSLSQLTILEEVYSDMLRSIRERQFVTFQQSQQELFQENLKTRSEVNALRKELAALQRQQQTKP